MSDKSKILLWYSVLAASLVTQGSVNGVCIPPLEHIEKVNIMGLLWVRKQVGETVHAWRATMGTSRERL
jgi:hypothetical protein